MQVLIVVAIVGMLCMIGVASSLEHDRREEISRCLEWRYIDVPKVTHPDGKTPVTVQVQTPYCAKIAVPVAK